MNCGEGRPFERIGKNYGKWSEGRERVGEWRSREWERGGIGREIGKREGAIGKKNAGKVWEKGLERERGRERKKITVSHRIFRPMAVLLRDSES